MNSHSFRVKVLFVDLVNFPLVYMNMYKLSCHDFCRGYTSETKLSAFVAYLDQSGLTKGWGGIAVKVMYQAVFSVAVNYG